MDKNSTLSHKKLAIHIKSIKNTYFKHKTTNNTKKTGNNRLESSNRKQIKDQKTRDNKHTTTTMQKISNTEQRVMPGYTQKQGQGLGLLGRGGRAGGGARVGLGYQKINERHRTHYHPPPPL